MPAAASVPAVSSKETAQSVEVLEDLIKNLNVSGSQDEVNAASGNLASLFSGPIPEQTLPAKAVEIFKKQLGNKKDAVVRERALEAIRAIAAQPTVAAGVEPHLVSILGAVLAAIGDKMVPVKNAAQAAALTIAKAVNPNAVKAVLPPILESVANASKWAEKMTALECVDTLVQSAPATRSLAWTHPDVGPIRLS